MATVESRLRGIVVDQLGVSEEEVKNESQFIEDLGADSLDVVELIMAAEEEFDVSVDDEQAESLRTFGKAVEFISEKVK